MLMAVMVPREPRERWSDERLDDLNKKVDDGFADTKAEMRGGFARVDQDIRELRSEMNARFDKMNDSINTRFDAIHARFDAQNRTLMGIGVAIVAALIGVNTL
jgi:hypothetical protein